MLILSFKGYFGYAVIEGWLMSKLILSIFIVSILGACAIARVGMTMTEFKDSCWNAAWEDATEVRLDASRSIVVCPITNGFKNPQYQLFEGGILRRLVPKEEAIAILEDSKCSSFGTTANTAGYTKCRKYLAMVRAQEAEMERSRRKAAGLYLLSLQARTRPSNYNTLLLVNCTSLKVGNYISYTCY